MNRQVRLAQAQNALYTARTVKATLLEAARVIAEQHTGATIPNDEIDTLYAEGFERPLTADVIFDWLGENSDGPAYGRDATAYALLALRPKIQQATAEITRLRNRVNHLGGY